MPRLITVLVALALLATPAPSATTPEVRGMVVSCQTWGWEWGSDAMVRTLDELKALGVNWVCIHPYAGIRGDGSVRVPERWYEGADWLTRPIEEAHARGMKVFIKPHLAYWGSPFSWRGEIAFETDAQWDRFFDGYELWITRVAEVCKDADGFSVGTELDRTIHHDEAWRRIIASVRDATDAPLTYSANWSDYERVGFWDDLDAIGVQAYFPLTDEEGLPEPQTLRRAWRRVADRLEAFAREHDRPIVLTELGYNRSSAAAIRPWESRSGGPNAEETQRRCLDAALDELAGRERVVGAFLWKWFPGETRGENFLKSTPAMRQVIARHWVVPSTAAETPR